MLDEDYVSPVTAFENLSLNRSDAASSLIFQKRFPDAASSIKI